MKTDHPMTSIKFKISLLLLSATLSLANTCHREGPDCHHGIVIENASSDSIIFALKFYNLTHNNLTHCGLDGEVLLPNSRLDWHNYRVCWKSRLPNGKSEEIYFNNNVSRLPSMVIGRQNAFWHVPNQNPVLLYGNSIFNPYPFNTYPLNK